MSGLKASNISSLDLGGLFRSILALIDVSNGTNGVSLLFTGTEARLIMAFVYF